MTDAKDSTQECPARTRSLLVVGGVDLDTRLFDHLVKQEWTVEYVRSNDEALQALRRRPFDLVVTSEGTSAVEDVDLLQRIRTFRPHTRMIILAREGTADDVLLALREHAFSYFSGPYTFESLKDMIHMAMEQPCWDDGIEVISATSIWVRLMVRCERGTADRLMQFFVEMVDMPDEEKGHVAYAFREMLMNAISYGGKLDPSQYVEIQYLRARRAIACRIKDPGEGFAFEDLLHSAVKNPPDDPFRHINVREEAGLPAGGYGILLSMHLVDELVYNEQGNEVLLIKYLNSDSTSRRFEFKTA